MEESLTVKWEGDTYRVDKSRMSAVELKDGKEVPVSGKLVATLLYEGLPIKSNDSKIMKTVKGLLIVFSAMCIWTLGVVLLTYLTSILPAAIIGIIVLVVACIAYVRITDIYG